MGIVKRPLSAYKRVLQVPVSCVTFSSPRVGNADFAAQFTASIDAPYRVVNKSDPLCMVPDASVCAPSPSACVAREYIALTSCTIRLLVCTFRRWCAERALRRGCPGRAAPHRCHHVRVLT
jgi:hypothetical protein